MINGLFLDYRIWRTDYLTNPHWNPEKYGLHIDAHPDAFVIPNKGVDSKYKFVIASEVWEIPMQKTLEYLRRKGLKIFLAPREMLPSEDFWAFFCSNRFKYKEGFYFCPDLLLSPNDFYARFWKGKADIEKVGCARYDSYFNLKFELREKLCKKFGLSVDKKIIFFPLFPPYYYQVDQNKKVYYADLSNDLEEIGEALDKFCINNKNEFQIISKLHPYAQKCYDKVVNGGKEIPLVLKKYYDHPTNYFKIIKDIRMDGTIGKNLLHISDLVMGFRTTMILEAHVLKKPVIHLMFKESSKLGGMPEYVKSIFTLNSGKELIAALSEKDFSRFTIKDDKIIEYCLGPIDGNFCERICNSIKNLMQRG